MHCTYLQNAVARKGLMKIDSSTRKLSSLKQRDALIETMLSDCVMLQIMRKGKRLVNAISGDVARDAINLRRDAPSGLANQLLPSSSS